MALLETVGLVVVGAAISQVQQLISRRWNAKDRNRDRDLARADKHDDDLRAAYAGFVGASAALLDRFMIHLSLERGIHELETDQEGVSKDIQLRARQAFEDVLAAGTAVEASAVAVLLLETNLDRRRRIKAIAFDPLVLPRDASMFEAASADYKRRRAEHDQLIDALAGSFAPATRRELAPPVAGALPAGRE